MFMPGILILKTEGDRKNLDRAIYSEVKSLKNHKNSL